MYDVNVKIGPDSVDKDDLLSINIKEYHYPVYFKNKNICVSCGAEGELAFVNIFGKEVKHEIHPFEFLQCKRCGAKYSIKWDKSNEDQKLYPSAVDKSFIKDFVNNFVANKEKEFE